MMCGGWRYGYAAVFPGGLTGAFQFQTPGAVIAAAESNHIW